MSRGDDRLATAAVGIWLLCLVLGIVFWLGVIYIAVHFIGKFW